MAVQCWLRFGKELLRPSILSKDYSRLTCQISQTYNQKSNREYSVWTNGDLLQESRLCCKLTITREASNFFTRLKADDIWSALTTVSNPGRKRGRSRQTKGIRKDFNRGQRIGEGPRKMTWPGLNTPIKPRGQRRAKIEDLGIDKERDERLQEARSTKKRFREKVPPLRRGWSGNRLPGMSVGPPDPIADYKFEGFDTRVLEFKLVCNITGNMGKKMSWSAFVITGNGNGVAGYAIAKAANGNAAIKKAKNKAGQKLQYIERYNDHTVYHNFHAEKFRTSMFVNKGTKGTGITAHRAIKTICDVIGIQDLSVKVEGPTGNIQNLTKAFFEGLGNQETHQQLADRTGLNVCEYNSSVPGVPVVIARPAVPKDRSKLRTTKQKDFETLYYKGRYPYIKPKPVPFYQKTSAFKKKQFVKYKRRNQPACQQERIVYGLEPTREERAFRSLPLK